MARKNKTSRSASSKASRPRKPAREKGPSALARWVESLRPETRQLCVRWTVRLCLAVAVLSLLAAGAKMLETAVHDHRPDQPTMQIFVQLENVPAWMPYALADHLARAVGPPKTDYDDPDFLAEVYRRAERIPWFAEVHRVRKRRDASAGRCYVVVEAAYREPLACVQREDGRTVFVSADRCVLPAEQVPLYRVVQHDAGGEVLDWRNYASLADVPETVLEKVRRIHYVRIQGVSSRPPQEGRIWEAADLADGLRLVKLFRRKSYFEEITAVDVSNFNRRRRPGDADLRMYAQSGRTNRTAILFGRFPDTGGDYVVAPDRKAENLDRVVAENGGRLAGIGRDVNLQHDPPYYLN